MALKLKVIVLVAACGLVVAPAALAAHNEKKDVEAVKAVVERFRQAIITKDKGAFTALFFSEDPNRVTWQFVADDARVERLRKTVKPDAIKARYVPQSNYRTFIDSVVSRQNRAEDIFSNVAIDTDGDVASVNYDYKYLAGGKETNNGREMWHLVRTEQGWKIISVIWSIHDPSDPG